MSEWKKTIISDIADFNSRSVNKDFKFDVIEYIDTSSVEKGQLTNTQKILLKEAPSRAKRRIQKNDILISSVRPNLEHYYFVDNCKENTVVSTGFVVITPKEETYPYFLYCLLTTEQYTQYLTQVANSHTSTYPSFNPEVIENSILSIPDYPEQKRIADVLSCLDAKIENLRRQNETLEQIAQTLFKHWFIDFEFPFDFAQGKPNADGKPYKLSGGAMVASELGDIPEGWKVGKFEDFIEKIIDNRGKTPPIEEDGVLMMEGNQIYCEHSFPQYADKAKQKFVSEETYNNWFRAGHPQYLDILCATVGTLPKWCFMPSNQALCIAQNIIGIRADKKVCSPYWLRLFMNTRYFIKSVLGRLLTTAQPSIKVGHMTSIEVIIPNIEIISLFDVVVSSLFRKIEIYQEQIQTLTKIRDSLLPKLMSGQIRVEA